MPERNPTVNPQYFAGTSLMSGTPNTGQVLFTTGGQKTFTNRSGVVGGTAAIWVGAGRLESVTLHGNLEFVSSGLPIIFFDCAAPLSGLLASGNILARVVPSQLIAVGFNTLPPQSGLLNFGGLVPMAPTVFTSGLSYTGASGQGGFTCTYTPVISG